MKQYLFPALLLACLTTNAQEVREEKLKEKPLAKKEKIVVEVDGDKVTINGKPAAEWNGDEVRILKDRIPMIRMGKGFPFEAELLNDKVNKAVLGVMSEKADKGARIVEVSKESAAEKAGLKSGDIITKVGDKSIADSDALYEAIGKYNPDDKVSISYLRDGKAQNTSAVLGKRSPVMERRFNFNGKDFDMDLDGIMENFRMPDGIREPREIMEGRLNRPKAGIQIEDLDNGKGVKVLDVQPELPAAKAGLKKDDIITKAGDKEINSVDDLREILLKTKEGDNLTLSFQRDGKNQSTELRFPKKLKKATL
jgi:serine protease Do